MRRFRAGGFTLLEVLVALFVLAVGVIGAAAAQNKAAQTRLASAQLSAAVALAHALAEGMAANPAQLALPDTDNVYLQDAGPPWHCADACTPAQLAATERDDAAARAARSFPGGQVRVCRDTLPAPLAWDCAGGLDAPLVVKIGWRAPDFVPMTAVPVPEAP
ncbi:type IV pilus modification protein PilV [Massilia sp. S19_KUP03_FR1]|uniref:type IV pilus modification protein PilV n=1 Tax=Massilia sp. S19_KUP03_FR1 TaxID=3025503 RepID=UPI002FCCD584